MRPHIIIAALLLGGCDYLPLPSGDYGIRVQVEPWDEIQLVSHAPLVSAVACDSPASEAGIKPGDWLVRVDDLQLSSAIRPTFERGMQVIARANREITVGICRGRCRPAIETQALTLKPRRVDWQACGRTGPVASKKEE